MSLSMENEGTRLNQRWNAGKFYKAILLVPSNCKKNASQSQPHRLPFALPCTAASQILWLPAHGKDDEFHSNIAKCNSINLLIS
jgi:hypothetical protein